MRDHAPQLRISGLLPRSLWKFSKIHVVLGVCLGHSIPGPSLSGVPSVSIPFQWRKPLEFKLKLLQCWCRAEEDALHTATQICELGGVPQGPVPVPVPPPAGCGRAGASVLLSAKPPSSLAVSVLGLTCSLSHWFPTQPQAELVTNTVLFVLNLPGSDPGLVGRRH